MSTRRETDKDRYGPFLFRSVPTFELPTEVWDIEHVEANKDVIQAYFRNGPNPLDVQFLYKRTIREYIKTRFPSDDAIRGIIDQTIKGLGRVNIRLVVGKKVLAILALAALFGSSVWLQGHFQADQEGLSRIAVCAAAVAVTVAIILWMTMSSLHACMQDICMKFQAAFQQYTNNTFNFFKDAITHVDQEENEVSYDEWPARARQWFVSALWQPYRIEYAVLHFQQARHSAENNWNGIFGVELLGNLVSGAILILGALVLSVCDNVVHARVGFGLFALPLNIQVVLSVSLWLFLTWVLFDIAAIVEKVSVEVFGRTGLHRLAVGLRWALLITVLVLPVAFWAFLYSQGERGQSLVPHWREFLLVLAINALLAMTFWASASLDIIGKKLDTHKWHQAESFNIDEALGNQVNRDKRKIIDEKFRQKDTKTNETPRHRPPSEDRA